MPRRLLPLLLAIASAAAAAQAPGAIVQRTATSHPMQYLLSLPTGWTPGRSWPVVVAEESAEKDFRHAMERYVAARKDLPFILVMPYSVILGQSGTRDPAIYPYTPATWDRIDREGSCSFELAGLDQVLQEVRTAYHGESRVYVTGLEAGSHLAWALAFKRPGQLAAVAPVAGNFRERCLEDGQVSSDPARADLPIQAFIGANDQVWLKAPAHDQFLAAKRFGEAHGYRRIGETVVPGHGHEALAAEVLAWFQSLRGGPAP
ncbi:MAG: hypothetical protein ACXU8N_03755 [Telluria sp.]